ncbi:hypothetical protein FA15DRAFT_659578 [Coprinopsis marcescibilis]|uniref:Uncharacterized protein n=1 Tax=Coprinopsis marcescibilis TaxID=230819 RepID=A0A5C3KIG6_COPMA|nr:hypothetical protein FA15DRAFT_659578 [Coprinopsis marcescibilis]
MLRPTSSTLANGSQSRQPAANTRPKDLNKAKDAVFVENGSAVACPALYGAIYIYNLSSSSPKEILRHGPILPLQPLDCEWGWCKEIQHPYLEKEGLFNTLVLFAMFSMTITQWPDATTQVIDVLKSSLPNVLRNKAPRSPTTVVYVLTITTMPLRSIEPMGKPLQTEILTLAVDTEQVKSQATDLSHVEPFSAIPDGYFKFIKTEGAELGAESDSLDV